MKMECSECHKPGGLLMRCGFEGRKGRVGCRRIICEECVAGYWTPGDGGVRRPLCKNCVTVK